MQDSSTSQGARCAGLLPTSRTAEMGNSDPKLTLPCWPGSELLIGEGVWGGQQIPLQNHHRV